MSGGVRHLHRVYSKHFTNYLNFLLLCIHSITTQSKLWLLNSLAFKLFFINKFLICITSTSSSTNTGILLVEKTVPLEHAHNVALK